MRGTWAFGLATLAVSATLLAVSADDASADGSNVASKGADGGTSTKSRERLYDPENVRGMSRAMETFLAGVEKYKARDYTGALETFRSGITLNPKMAIGHLFAAEACLALNKLEDADTFIKDAEGLTDDRDPELRAKALYAVADIKERRGRSVEAEASWLVYAQYASQHPDAGAHPLTAQTRLSYLAEYIKLEKAYEGVRQRMLREKDAGVDAR